MSLSTYLYKEAVDGKTLQSSAKQFANAERNLPGSGQALLRIWKAIWNPQDFAALERELAPASRGLEAPKGLLDSIPTPSIRSKPPKNLPPKNPVVPTPAPVATRATIPEAGVPGASRASTVPTYGRFGAEYPGLPPSVPPTAVLPPSPAPTPPSGLWDGIKQYGPRIAGRTAFSGVGASAGASGDDALNDDALRKSLHGGNLAERAVANYGDFNKKYLFGHGTAVLGAGTGFADPISKGIYRGVAGKAPGLLRRGAALSLGGAALAAPYAAALGGEKVWSHRDGIKMKGEQLERGNEDRAQLVKDYAINDARRNALTDKTIADRTAELEKKYGKPATEQEPGFLNSIPNWGKGLGIGAGALGAGYLTHQLMKGNKDDEDEEDSGYGPAIAGTAAGLGAGALGAGLMTNWQPSKLMDKNFWSGKTPEAAAPLSTFILKNAIDIPDISKPIGAPVHDMVASATPPTPSTATGPIETNIDRAGQGSWLTQGSRIGGYLSGTPTRLHPTDVPYLPTAADSARFASDPYNATPTGANKPNPNESGWIPDAYKDQIVPPSTNIAENKDNRPLTEQNAYYGQSTNKSAPKPGESPGQSKVSPAMEEAANGILAKQFRGDRTAAQEAAWKQGVTQAAKLAPPEIQAKGPQGILDWFMNIWKGLGDTEKWLLAGGVALTAIGAISSIGGMMSGSGPGVMGPLLAVGGLGLAGYMGYKGHQNYTEDTSAGLEDNANQREAYTTGAAALKNFNPHQANMLLNIPPEYRKQIFNDLKSNPESHPELGLNPQQIATLPEAWLGVDMLHQHLGMKTPQYPPASQLQPQQQPSGGPFNWIEQERQNVINTLKQQQSGQQQQGTTGQPPPQQQGTTGQPPQQQPYVPGQVKARVAAMTPEQQKAYMAQQTPALLANPVLKPYLNPDGTPNEAAIEKIIGENPQALTPAINAMPPELRVILANKLKAKLSNSIGLSGYSPAGRNAPGVITELMKAGAYVEKRLNMQELLRMIKEADVNTSWMANSPTTFSKTQPQTPTGIDTSWMSKATPPAQLQPPKGVDTSWMAEPQEAQIPASVLNNRRLHAPSLLSSLNTNEPEVEGNDNPLLDQYRDLTPGEHVVAGGRALNQFALPGAAAASTAGGALHYTGSLTNAARIPGVGKALQYVAKPFSGAGKLGFKALGPLNNAVAALEVGHAAAGGIDKNNPEWDDIISNSRGDPGGSHYRRAGDSLALIDPQATGTSRWLDTEQVNNAKALQWSGEHWNGGWENPPARLAMRVINPAHSVPGAARSLWNVGKAMFE